MQPKGRTWTIKRFPFRKLKLNGRAWTVAKYFLWIPWLGKLLRGWRMNAYHIPMFRDDPNFKGYKQTQLTIEPYPQMPLPKIFMTPTPYDDDSTDPK